MREIFRFESRGGIAKTIGRNGSEPRLPARFDQSECRVYVPKRRASSLEKHDRKHNVRSLVKGCSKNRSGERGEHMARACRAARIRRSVSFTALGRTTK